MYLARLLHVSRSIAACVLPAGSVRMRHTYLARISPAYVSLAGSAWERRDGWLEGEPCVDRWAGVQCCPDTLPVLRDAMCQSEDGLAAQSLAETRVCPTHLCCISLIYECISVIYGCISLIYACVWMTKELFDLPLHHHVTISINILLLWLRSSPISLFLMAAVRAAAQPAPQETSPGAHHPSVSRCGWI